MTTTVLVANRGEIALRVLRTVRAMGLRGVVAYAPVDEGLPFVAAADDALEINLGSPAGTYRDIDGLLAAASRLGADAVHPGYGFLSESAEFATRVKAAGLTWVGPDPDAIELMGDKVRSRTAAAESGVPVSRGSAGPVNGIGEALSTAVRIGFPVMVKAAAGGGGLGMQVARDPAQLDAAVRTTASRAERIFGDGTILVEQYIAAARHVEVQVLGLADGQVVVLGDRDCSVQRRFQKVVEEAPAALLTDEQRRGLYDAARRVAQIVDYRGVGTVEFLVDGATGDFVFCEMNTRLQVEHPVTELITSLDLVELQLSVALGSSLPPLEPEVGPTGHAIELRVYAEDPETFLPTPGKLTSLALPEGPGIRVDAGYVAGNTVTHHFDPLVAKICTWGSSREEAISRARSAVADTTIRGLTTNLPFLDRVLANPLFQAGGYDTRVVRTMQEGSAIGGGDPRRLTTNMKG